jgi:hypothetical protein
MGDIRNAYDILVGKSAGKKPLGRHRQGWEDHFRIDLMKKRWKLWTGFIWPRTGTGGGII